MKTTTLFILPLSFYLYNPCLVRYTPALGKAVPAAAIITAARTFPVSGIEKKANRNTEHVRREKASLGIAAAAVTLGVKM